MGAGPDEKNLLCPSGTILHEKRQCINFNFCVVAGGELFFEGKTFVVLGFNPEEEEELVGLIEDVGGRQNV